MLDAFAIALSMFVSLRRLLADRRERAVKSTIQDFGLLDLGHDGEIFGTESATPWLA